MAAGAPPGVSAPERALSVTLVLGAGTSILLGAAIATTLFDELGEAGTVLLRLAFAAAVLLAIWRPGLAGHSARAWRLAITFGLVVAAMNLSFYTAIDRIPLGIVSAIAFVGPLGVAVAGSRRPADALWVLLAALGVVLFTPLAGGSVDAAGIALSLLVGALWGAYILAAARVGQAFSGGQGLALAMAIGALVMIPGGVWSAGEALLRPEVLAIGVALALLSTAIPYSLELEALRRLDTRTFGILVSLQPAIAAIVGFLALGQSLSAAETVAIGLVVAASAGALGGARAPTPVEA